MTNITPNYLLEFTDYFMKHMKSAESYFYDNDYQEKSENNKKDDGYIDVTATECNTSLLTLGEK